MDEKKLVELIAQAADEKKGTDIVRIALGQVSVLADYFVLITGQSRAQVRAIAGSIADMAKLHDRVALHIEGMGDASWILQDFGDVIVHTFLPQERGFYQLEAFWGHAPRQIYVPGPPPSWEDWVATEAVKEVPVRVLP
ncbi:ribosome silencing factor [Anthocerotibacter panamensis]|uniref:ribosome silencing factor n=1 Tax=Anthocerotibacter panamensis TaxID=2857077 RepID=UPI001C40492B|nr:ribosome silencing factor [Anthocerotibacter panamensis]